MLREVALNPCAARKAGTGGFSIVLTPQKETISLVLHPDLSRCHVRGLWNAPLAAVDRWATQAISRVGCGSINDRRDGSEASGTAWRSRFPRPDHHCRG